MFSYRYFLPVLFLLYVIIGCKESEQSKSFVKPIEESIYAIENGLYTKVQIDSVYKTSNILDQMSEHNVPGLSIAVVNNGQIEWAKGYGTANSLTKKQVNNNTLFQAASISKPITVLGILRLYDLGLIDLDTNVNSYLKKWNVPENKFTTETPVTIRQLLTHTAGVTVHGFPGYTNEEEIPTLVEILEGKGNTDVIEVDTKPGLMWRYSGGGYTILQCLIEDVSGESFSEYMSKYILKPLGMNNSHFNEQVDSSLASAAFNSKGEMIPHLWNRYPEKAAAGLWTTPTDLAKYCVEIQNIKSGKKDGILKRSTIEMILNNHIDNWGLGVILDQPSGISTFGHSGKNIGYTNQMRACVDKGQAIIVLTNGDNGKRIIDDIIRSVSTYYNWDIHSVKRVNPITLSTSEMKRLAGSYVYRTSTEETFIDISLKDDILYLIDTTYQLEFDLTPISANELIGIKDNVELAFSTDSLDQITGFTWNKRYKIEKVK